MSVSVELERVQEEAAQRGPGAFLLTVTDDGRPHVVAVAIRWQGDALVMGTGRSSARNAGARPAVTVLWPPAEPGGYSLIVDGEAAVETHEGGGEVTLRATRAVLHRPGAAGSASSPGCGSDCVPLLPA